MLIFTHFMTFKKYAFEENFKKKKCCCINLRNHV